LSSIAAAKSTGARTPIVAMFRAKGPVAFAERAADPPCPIDAKGGRLAQLFNFP
jgi:hypothetical protein